MEPTRGLSGDLDRATALKVARSFYLVRMVRHGLLLIAVLAIGGLAGWRRAPVAVPAAAVLLAVALGALMWLTRRRFRRLSASG